MAAIPLSELHLSKFKKHLSPYFDEVRSSHLFEAIAAALGRRTYASLKAELPSFQSDPPIVLLDESLFSKRMVELGYYSDDSLCFDLFRDAGLIRTICLDSGGIFYTDNRSKAWRNLLVCAINAGIELKHFSLRPDDDRWSEDPREGFTYDFTIRDGLLARAYVRNIGNGELAVHAAVNPIGRSLRSYNAGFSAGDAFATGWLERSRGAWIQTSLDLSCRRPLLPVLANLEVEPLGYGDRGKII